MKLKATIEIDMDNDAMVNSFDTNYTLWEIVGTWTDKVCHQGFVNMKLHDENGNGIGTVKVEKTE